MRRICVFAASLALTAWGAWGQNEPGLTQEADFTPTSAGVAVGDPFAEMPTGDTVILHDGRRFEGVQVVRITGTDYEIQVIEGVAPMTLPRSIVKEVIWDGHDPLGMSITAVDLPETVISAATPAARSEDMARDEAGNVEVLPGVRVPAQLVGKLRRDISGELDGIVGSELFEALRIIGERVQLRIVPDQPLRELVRDQRGLSVEAIEVADSPLTVAEFFHNYLLRQPALRGVDIVYMPDRLLVTTREAAMSLRAELAQAAPR